MLVDEQIIVVLYYIYGYEGVWRPIGVRVGLVGCTDRQTFGRLGLDEEDAFQAGNRMLYS